MNRPLCVFMLAMGCVFLRPALAQLPVTCLNIADDALRLDCFDEQARQTLNKKRAVDLADTLKSTWRAKKPQVLFFDKDKNQNKTEQDLQTEQDKKSPQEDEYEDQLESSAQGDEVLTEFGSPKEAIDAYTPLSLAYDLDKNSERGLWSARPHNANYILPFFVSPDPNRSPHTPTQPMKYFHGDARSLPELKFQLSLKSKVAQNLFDTDADLWIGYTQVSHWQVYNAKNSRPFRTHDYEPELFLTQPVTADVPFGGRLRVLGAGLVHYSNGETDPLSRSWNRAYVFGGMEWERLTVMPRLWARVLKRRERGKPEDNPDVYDYYGFGDVRFLYKLKSGSTMSGTVRLNPLTGKGAVQLDYVLPLRKGISGYAQVFHGYGESFVDYNYKNTSVGLGVMLNEWMGL